MSYCRFGWDGSNVYVFVSRRGIECCGCLLGQPDLVTRSANEMIEHLEAHRAAGHTVPQYAMDRLADPEDQRENEAIWMNALVQLKPASDEPPP